MLFTLLKGLENQKLVRQVSGCAYSRYACFSVSLSLYSPHPPSLSSLSLPSSLPLSLSLTHTHTHTHTHNHLCNQNSADPA